MPLRRRFSTNLRILCQNEKSYAGVARKLSLNRQQFNDYLHGKSLPNETIIAKICAYFEIDVEELFASDRLKNLKRPQHHLNVRHKAFIERYHNAAMIDRPKIRSGLYYIYFLVPNWPQTIVCSLLAIENDQDGDIPTFRRITRTENMSSGAMKKAQSLHIGILVGDDDDLELVGLDVFDSFAPSLIALKRVFHPSVIFAGQALLKVFDYQLVNLAMVPVSDGIDLKKALKNVACYQSDSERNNSDVVEFFARDSLKSVV